MYNWSTDEKVQIEMFVGTTPALGIMIGRFFGSYIVNKGRYPCIMISSLILSAGIGLMLVENIWVFLLGRFICAFGIGVFFAASARYIEECSPPHLLAILFSVLSFGASLSGPLLSLVSYILLPNKD
jgi:MFS family permease